MTTETPDFTVRQARRSDEAAVIAFTTDTWSDRGSDDYIPRVFTDWVESDGPQQRTLVLEVDEGGDAVSGEDGIATGSEPGDHRGEDGSIDSDEDATLEDVDPADVDIAGICQGVLLSEYEAWAQGMRMNPAYRGYGASRLLTDALFDWARDRGATVMRNMVFSWNVAGLGQSRSAGFEPCTEFRYATPDPNPDAASTLELGSDPTGAWSFWTQSDVRTELSGLVMDDEESWSLSELTRDRLENVDEADRLITVHDGGVRGFTYLDRTYERENNDGVEEQWALYGVAAWDTPAAAESLYAAVARDAADVGVDRVRVMIPEGVRWVSDTAAARVTVADEPDFVMAADLTNPALGSDSGTDAD